MGLAAGRRLIGREDGFRSGRAGQLVEAFLDGEVEMAPIVRERVNDAIGEHDHERMAASSGFEPDVDRPHLQMDRLALPEGPLDEG